MFQLLIFMEKNTNCLVSKVDLLNLLINNGYHTQSINALRKTVQSWIDDLQDDYSPVSYLGEEMFIRYLNYMLVYKIDCLIGNEKPFVPDQDYEQEYNRFIKVYLQLMNDGDTETDLVGMKTAVNKFVPCEDHGTVPNVNSVSNVQYFTEVFIKSNLNYVTYYNFIKYKELYKTDLAINNCRPFCATQNYSQELTRQCRTTELIELIKHDSSFEELFYTVDCAIQDRFLRGLDKTSPNVTKHHITKLW